MRLQNVCKKETMTIKLILLINCFRFDALFRFHFIALHLNFNYSINLFPFILKNEKKAKKVRVISLGISVILHEAHQTGNAETFLFV